jgi:preprotein translocase subunit SecE
MFAQNPNNIINHPINYASRLMTRIEKIIWPLKKKYWLLFI